MQKLCATVHELCGDLLRLAPGVEALGDAELRAAWESAARRLLAVVDALETRARESVDIGRRFNG
jgi:hypothetical protein